MTQEDVEALNRLKAYVDRKNRDIGLVDPQVCTVVDGLHSSVNAEDIWVGPMANEEAAWTKLDIDALRNVFSGLSDTISDAITNAGGSG